MEYFFGKRKQQDRQDTSECEDTGSDIQVNVPVAPSESELDKLKKQRHAADFDNTWMKNRSWLEYVRGSGPNSGMFCTFCQKYDKRPFGREAWNKVGCKIIRLVGPSAHRHEPTTKIGLATTLMYMLLSAASFMFVIVKMWQSL